MPRQCGEHAVSEHLLYFNYCHSMKAACNIQIKLTPIPPLKGSTWNSKPASSTTSRQKKNLTCCSYHISFISLPHQLKLHKNQVKELHK